MLLPISACLCNYLKDIILSFLQLQTLLSYPVWFVSYRMLTTITPYKMLHINNNRISFENYVNAYKFILNTKKKMLCTVPSFVKPFLCVSKLMMVTYITPHKSTLIYIFLIYVKLLCVCFASPMRYTTYYLSFKFCNNHSTILHTVVRLSLRPILVACI